MVFVFQKSTLIIFSSLGLLWGKELILVINEGLQLVLFVKIKYYK